MQLMTRLFPGQQARPICIPSTATRQPMRLAPFPAYRPRARRVAARNGNERPFGILGAVAHQERTQWNQLGDQKLQSNVVYYRRAGGGMGPGVQPFPVGLRMIAGDAKATSDQSLSIVAWDCGGGGLRAPTCTPARVGPRHRSTLPSYSLAAGTACTSTVPIQVDMAYALKTAPAPPTTRVAARGDLRADYPGIAGGPDYSLASGGIYSLHGDFIADWDNQVQNALWHRASTSRMSAATCTDGDTLFRPAMTRTRLRSTWTTSRLRRPANQPLQGLTSPTTPMPMSMPM